MESNGKHSCNMKDPPGAEGRNTSHVPSDQKETERNPPAELHTFEEKGQGV